MSNFQVNRLQPIDDDFWKAELEYTALEEIEGRAFGQNINLTIRFRYPATQSADGLVAKAISEAKRQISAASNAS